MQITRALSNEWASKGVTVNAIAPGYMATELTANMKEVNPKQYGEITGRIPMERWGNPEINTVILPRQDLPIAQKPCKINEFRYWFHEFILDSP